MAVIITDSTCDLTTEELKKSNVKMLSLKVNFGDKHYLDKVDLTSEEFFEKLRSSDELPTTSLLNPADFESEFEKYPDDDLIVITIASALSGTYQSAVIAAQMIGRDNIYVVDSQNVTAGLGLLVKHAARMNNDGVPAAEIVAEITRLSDKVRVVALIDTLKYLVKGGRVSSVSGYMGTLLNIKPIIEVSRGAIKPIAKARGNADAVKKMKEIITEQMPIDFDYEVCFAHANDEPRLVQMMQELNLDGEKYMIGSVVGTHSGDGAVAVVYIEK